MQLQGLILAGIILATVIFATAAQPSASTGDAIGLATVNADGRTIGATSTANGTAANMTDIDDVRGPTNPTMPAPPVVSPPTGAPKAGAEGMARLVDRIDVNDYATGTLQIFSEGAWGAVCSSYFDDQDARVACRRLGFISGVRRFQIPRSSTSRLLTFPDPEEAAPFVLGNLGCSGNESSLLDCPVFAAVVDDSRVNLSGRCDPFQDTFARIACGTSDAEREGGLRLANGVAAVDGSAEYGRLEVFHDGGWGTVCDNSFSAEFSPTPTFSTGSADVACRELGYQQGLKIQRLEDVDEDSIERVPIVLAGAACEGSEATLAECPEFELGDAPFNCRHSADANLVCFNGPNPQMDGATRLADGSADPAGQFEYGRLEIFARGFWSNVCNNGRFTPDAAQVACRALGYDGGAALRFTQSYARSLSPVLFENLPVALAAVDCDGTEAAISECQSNNNLIGECDEITSSTVLACANSAAGCGVQDGTTEGSVRLRGGFGTPCDPVHSGFIEVLHFGEWGSICTDRRAENREEDNLVADVVCRQLGFPHGTRVNPLTAQAPLPDDEGMSSYYNSATEEADEPVERYWLTSVGCAGQERALIDCDLGEGFLQKTTVCKRRGSSRMHIACRQFPVLEALEEIRTPDAEEGDLRLIDQGEVENWTTGRLQVFFEGSWSQVCSTNFTAADATVACRQLGFGAGTVVPQALSIVELNEFRKTNIYPEVAILGAGCKGTEEQLVECIASAPRSGPDYFDEVNAEFSRDCLNSEGDGLVLGCVTAPFQGPSAGTEGAFRLNNKTAGVTPGSEAGILEIFHAGAWGTVCDGGLNTLKKTAVLACRDRGFVSGILQDVISTAPVLPPWLSGIRCSGAEAELTACPRSAFGETLACGPTQRLLCFTSRQGTGEARLVGGSADPGGAWEYGVLEVVVNGVLSIVQDRQTERFGRRGVEVACRSLGYATGGQLLAGDGSPFMAPDGALRLTSMIRCNGTEEQLGDCSVEMADYEQGDLKDNDLLGITSLICSTPSGCSEPGSPPQEGDVRLVPLIGATVATASCDDVHLGGVELFYDGRWGRICAGRFGGFEAKFTLAAQVVCRQLGFPISTVMDAKEVFGASGADISEDLAYVWANEVVCTGKEESLLDCVFPQNFGIDYGFDIDNYSQFFADVTPSPPDAGPAPAPPEVAPSPNNGLSRSTCSRNEGNRFAVICRRFQIPESDFIRR